MKIYDNLYCKIYIDSELNRDELTKLISELAQGKIHRWSVITQELEIDIRNNEDFNIDKINNFPDGFLYYRFYLDIEPNEIVEQTTYIQSIARILKSFWNHNCKAIAACDFEEELPRKGGYNWQE